MSASSIRNSTRTWEDQSGKRPSSWYHQQLNKERIKKWKTPLIIPATLPDQTEMLSVIVDAFKTLDDYMLFEKRTVS